LRVAARAAFGSWKFEGARRDGDYRGRADAGRLAARAGVRSTFHSCDRGAGAVVRLGGGGAAARFLSTLSQSRFTWLYFAVSLGISLALYRSLDNVAAALPMFIVIYQAINFHHYITASTA
jgi:hypothetical protein